MAPRGKRCERQSQYNQFPSAQKLAGYKSLSRSSSPIIRLLEEAGEPTNHKIPATKLWWFVVFIACRKRQKVHIAKPRLRSGGLAAFPLEVAAENDKTQRKQAENNGVFFHLGNDRPSMKAKSLLPRWQFLVAQKKLRLHKRKAK